jgi:hypothetical protein
MQSWGCSSWNMAARNPRRGAPLIAALAGALLVAGACKDDPDPIDPDDAYVQPGDHVVAIHIRPDRVQLDPETTFELLCVGLTDDGYLATLDDCNFEIAEGDAVQVHEAGRLTPASTGTAQVLARRGELASSLSTVEVIPAGTLDVRVTAHDGRPLRDAEVRVGTPTAVATGTTGEDGAVHLEGDWSGPLDLVILAEDNRPTVLMGVRARNVVAAVEPFMWVSPRVKAYGEVEFMEEPAVGEMALAIALTSTPVGPAFTSVADFMPGNRHIDKFGLNIDLPQNLVIKGIEETFITPIYEGKSVIMVAGGYFDLSEVLIVAQQLQEQGVNAVFNVIGVYADRLMIGLEGPLDVRYENTNIQWEIFDIEVSMDIPLDREVMVTLLSPPPDFWSVDPPTVLAYRELEGDLGWIIAGVGVGQKPFWDPDTDPPEADDDDNDDATGNYISLPPDKPWETVPMMEASAGHLLSTPYTIYGAMAVYEGLGETGDASMSFSPPMTGTDVVLPPFLPLYDLVVSDEPLGSFEYAGTPGVDAVRAIVNYREVVPGAVDPVRWHRIFVYAEGGSGEFSLPADLIDFTPPATETLAETENAWTLDAVGLRATNFQCLVTDDGLDGLERFQIATNQRSVVKERWWHDATLPE